MLLVIFMYDVIVCGDLNEPCVPPPHGQSEQWMLIRAISLN